MGMKTHRLEGRGALGKYLSKVVEETVSSKVVCAFDFDRTLTNGTSFEEDASIDRRIRGGDATLTALENLKALGADYYVVTARSPREMVIKQLQESLRRGQKELGKLFDSSGTIEVIKFNGVDLATGGDLYACGYEKFQGVLHALLRSYEDLAKSDERISLHFVDDAVVNSATVFRQLRNAAKDGEYKNMLKQVDVNVVWWDPYSEETGKNTSMDPLHSQSSDFNFHEHLERQLELFGIDKEERELRRNVYLAEEKEYGRKPPPTAVEKPKPKRLKNVNQANPDLMKLLSRNLK